MRVNVITMLRNLGPFAKSEHGVFSLPPHMEGVPQKWEMFISRHGLETITARVVRIRYLRAS